MERPPSWSRYPRVISLVISLSDSVAHREPVANAACQFISLLRALFES